MPGPKLPVGSHTVLTNLAMAHARVSVGESGYATVFFGDVNVSMQLTDTEAVVRQLLVDALAQLDAIGAS